METPTLSKAQKKSTLSAKKNKPKETIKNIVATPFKNSYWPRISSADYETLKVVLENNLPLLKPVKIKVPWTVLENIPKADRKKFRNEYGGNSEVQVNKEASEGINLGINDTAKLLENNSVDVILIASDVQPRLLVQHLIDLAVLYKVFVIIVDNLRDTLSTFCGISSAVMCINKNLSTESKLCIIKEKVIQISKKYPPPKNHINYNRSLKHFGNVNKIIENSESVIDKTVNTGDKSPESKEQLEQRIYLKRESKDKRAFIPENFEKYVNVHKMEVDSTGFLPFTETSELKNTSKSTKDNNCKYRSLVVKRLKGDPNRLKRKVASIKRKLK